MKLKSISTEVDYEKALARVDKIFDSELGSKNGDELEALALLIEDYESKNYPIESPDPMHKDK